MQFWMFQRSLRLALIMYRYQRKLMNNFDARRYNPAATAACGGIAGRVEEAAHRVSKGAWNHSS